MDSKHFVYGANSSIVAGGCPGLLVAFAFGGCDIMQYFNLFVYGEICDFRLAKIVVVRIGK
jgi:hypothetical protein